MSSMTRTMRRKLHRRLREPAYFHSKESQRNLALLRRNLIMSRMRQEKAKQDGSKS